MRNANEMQVVCTLKHTTALTTTTVTITAIGGMYNNKKWPESEVGGIWAGRGGDKGEFAYQAQKQTQKWKNKKQQQPQTPDMSAT